MIDKRICSSGDNDFNDEIKFIPILIESETVQKFKESLEDLIEKVVSSHAELEELLKELPEMDTTFPFTSEEVEVFKTTFPHNASPKLDFLYGEIVFNFLIQDEIRLSAITNCIPFSKEYAWRGVNNTLKKLWNTKPQEVENKLINFAFYYKENLATDSLYKDQDYFSEELTSLRSMQEIEKIISKMHFFHHFIIHYNKGEIIFLNAFNLSIELGIKLLNIVDNPLICNYVFYTDEIRYDAEKICEILEQKKDSDTSRIIIANLLLCYIHYVDCLYDYFQAREELERKNFLEVEVKSLLKALVESLKKIDPDERLRWGFFCYLSQKAYRGRYSKRITIDQIYFETFSLCISSELMEAKVAELNHIAENLLKKNIGAKVIQSVEMDIYEFSALLSIYQNRLPKYFEVLSNIFVSILYSKSSNLFISSIAEHLGKYPNNQDYLHAMLFLKSNSPVESWCEVWKQVLPIRFRLVKNPYDEVAPSDAYYYMLIIGIALFDWLLDPNFENPLEREKLWSKLWEIIFTDWLTFAKQQNYSTIEALLVSLIVRKAIHYKDNSEKCIEELTHYIKAIGDCPFLIAIIAHNLDCNISKEIMKSLLPLLEPNIRQFTVIENCNTSKRTQHPRLLQACNQLLKS